MMMKHRCEEEKENDIAPHASTTHVRIVQDRGMSLLESEVMNAAYERKIDDFLNSSQISCLPWEQLKVCLRGIGAGAPNLQQVTSLKKFGAVLKKQAITDREKDLCCDVLTQLCVKVDPKGALHRGIVSILQGFPSSDHELVSMKLSSAISNQLTLCSKTDTRECRKSVDAVCGLLDNFLLGERSLSVVPVFGQVVEFLSEVLHMFMRSTRSLVDSIGQNEAMYNCMAAIKATIAVVQRCYMLEAHASNVENVQRTMETMLQTMWDVLSDASYLADCRSAAGMALVLLQRSLVTGDENQLSSVVYSALFGHLSASPCLPTSQRSVHPRPSRFDTTLLPAQSYLFVCHGVLAMLDPKDLMAKGLPLEGQCLLLNVLFPEILGLTERLTEPGSALTAARTLTLWTAIAVVAVTSGCHDYNEVYWVGPAEIPQKLIHYVWTNWDHPIDGIRYQTKTIFENVLQLHVITKQQADYVLQRDPFLLHLLDSLVTVNWHVRGKYMPLGCLVTHIGAEQILASYPTMPLELFRVFGDQTLAPYACDLLERLFSNHKSSLTKDKQDTEGVLRWQKTWIVPFLEFLCSPTTSKDQKTYLIEYCVPRLLKCSPESLGFIVTHLHRANGSLSPSMAKSGLLGALVTCLKTARSMGLIREQDRKGESDHPGDVQSEASLWKGLVPYGKLKEALCHKESQIRIDGLGLLCDCNKTTEAVSSQELSLLQFFLMLNIGSTSPSFRQTMGAHLKKLFIRIRENGRVCQKQLTSKLQKKETVKSASSAEVQIKMYKGFMAWLIDFLFEALRPGNSYPKRAVVLHTLKTIAQIYNNKSKGSNSAFFDLKEVWTPDHIKLLLHRLTDPYESNKVMAFDLLSDLSQETLQLIDQRCHNQLFTDAMQLASSNKPHNCETASYLLRFLALGPTQSAKGTDTDPPQSIMGILSGLCRSLTEEVGVAQGSLLEAAVQGPMYGTLHCIRELLADVDLRTVSHSEGWDSMIPELIKLCLQVAQAASVVVCNSSPEGYIPQESNDALESPNQGSEDEASPSSSSVHSDIPAGKALKVTPQMVLVCCWRSMKEVSLLMGHLAMSAPLSLDHSSPGLISQRQLEEISHFFLRLLRESKHRGAFELAYAGFIMLTARLWKSESASLHQLPKQWLHDLLCDITASQSMLCATRRSAGIPFAIQALVGSEPSTQGKVCFKQAMETLLNLALPASGEGEAVISQIHALNILRVLYKDARLGEDVIPYIAEGVKAAILGFAAQLWAVRNSSTLLFSALVTRIFGVQRAKQDHDRRNCMTGKEFFARFPSLHPFLLQQLQEATSVNPRSGTARLHPSLFPVLLLLSRLYPSPMDGSHTRLSMDHFVPYVLSCAGSAVYKTRAIAARALVPLVPAHHQLDMLTYLLGLLPKTPDQPTHYNHIHGVLLQIREVLECSLHMPGSQESRPCLLEVMASMADYMWLASDDNGCFVTRAAFLDILETFLFKTPSLSSAVMAKEKSIEHLQTETFSIASGLIRTHNLQSGSALHQPDCVTLLTTCAAICLRQRSVQASFQTAAFSTEDPVADVRPYNPLTTNGTEKCIQCPMENPDHPLELVSGSAVVGRQAEFCDSNRSEQLSEEILVSLLSSPSYEVRHLALSHLIESSCCHPSELVMTSEALFQKLVAMVKEEEHKDCLCKVYELLSSHPRTCQFPWRGSEGHMTCTMCFQAAMDVASLPQQRGDVISSVIQFLTCLLPTLYYQLLSAEHGDTELAYKLLCDWSLLLDQCSKPDRTVQSRLTVVKAIDTLATVTLLDSTACLGNIPFVLWGVVMRLIQDDDIQVQHGAMSCIKKVAAAVDHSSDLYFTDAQPSLGLYLCVQLFTSVFIDRLPTKCLQSLMEWGVGCLEDARCNLEEETQDERLFDQGEANTTFEGVYLAKIIMNQLYMVAQRVKESQTCSEDASDQNIVMKQTGKDSCSEDSKREKEDSLLGQARWSESNPRCEGVCEDGKTSGEGDATQLGGSQDGRQGWGAGGVSSSDRSQDDTQETNLLQTSSQELTLLRGLDFLPLSISVRLSPATVDQLRKSAQDGILDLASRLAECLQVWSPVSPYLTAVEWETQCTDCYRILLHAEALTALVPEPVEASLVKRWAELLEVVRGRLLSDERGASCTLVSEPSEKLRLWCESFKDKN